ncbi:uncharacterized protein AMSG_06233 [Thecamonas trahens ATCC 50062]|uniref:Doublecortin domain-containing protein n=1 Tax=Thecamonas trahens ATCC 50062 TaxID=461836 RepID=A0A0L0DF34_THETB|nr:hypothetical protein AMSG_06233 [Thecamonas trahens ATCC 50062]KNC49928.1 hypothetical protein AMSG_06233 [Thecamonas trahens ATCC 50062]|eukprot:XP_013757407.1 hypothetical protein AMSG_06233 [Thecamonas trahens ATCC 50062]
MSRAYATAGLAKELKTLSKRQLRGLLGFSIWSFSGTLAWCFKSKMFTSPPPACVRLMVHANGRPGPAVPLAAPTLGNLLDDATRKLGLPSAARKLYDAQGREITKLDEVRTGADVYASCGEMFVDPKAPPESPMQRMSRLKLPPISQTLVSPKVTPHFEAYRNGAPHMGCVRISGATIPALLDDATSKLHLLSAARYIYDGDGFVVTDEHGSGVDLYASAKSKTVLDVGFGAKVYISCGEPFRDPRAKVADHKVHIRELPADSRLLPKQVKYAMVSRLGLALGLDNRPVRVIADSIKALKLEARTKFELAHPVRRIFTEDGTIVVDALPKTRSSDDHSSAPERDHGHEAVESEEATPVDASSTFVTQTEDAVASNDDDAASIKSANSSSSSSSSAAAAAGGAADMPTVPADADTADGAVASGGEEDRPEYVLFSELPNGVHLLVSMREQFEEQRSMEDIRELSADSRLVPEPVKRVFVLPNGENVMRRGIYVTGRKVYELLASCQARFHMQGRARKLYTSTGDIVVDSLEYGVEEPPQAKLIELAPVVRHVGSDIRVVPEPEARAPLTTTDAHRRGRRANAVHAARVAKQASPEAKGEKKARLAHDRPPKPNPYPVENCVELDSLANETVLWVSHGPKFSATTLGAAKDAREDIPPIPPHSRLLTKKAARVNVYKNGWYDSGKMIVASNLDELFARATEAHALHARARALYTLEGVQIRDMAALEPDMEVVVTTGEPMKARK